MKDLFSRLTSGSIVFCPVIQGEVSFGFQVEAQGSLLRIIGAGAKVDAASVRSRFGYWNQRFGLESVLSQSFGWSVALGLPETPLGFSHVENVGREANVATPDQWDSTSVSGPSTFIGLEAGLAYFLGASGKVGYEVVEGTGCPTN